MPVKLIIFSMMKLFFRSEEKYLGYFREFIIVEGGGDTLVSWRVIHEHSMQRAL